MRNSWKCKILITISFVFLVVDSFGELIVIRHPKKTNHGSSEMQLTCMSENDGGAMIWNNQFAEDVDFLPSPHIITSGGDGYPIIDRKTSKFGNWDLTNSLKNPMGPVFDYRFEGAGLLPGKLNRNGKSMMVVSNSGTFVFSVRASSNIFVRLCNVDTCYWKIKFKNSKPKNPTITSCSTLDCDSELYRDRSYLNCSLEWRTFIVNWAVEEGRVQAFVGGTELMAEIVDHKRGYTTALWIDTIDEALFKNHNYYYYLARENRKQLITSEFNETDGKLCFQLPVSLCSYCELNVEVVDRKGYIWTIENIVGDGKLAYGGLPMWQIVTINVTLANGYQNPIKLRFTSATDRVSKTNRWAIGISRPCNDAVRRSTQTLSSEMSYATCQKLSYTQNSVVHLNNRITNINSTILDECLSGVKLGLFCDFGCNGSCNGTSICDPTGCTCAPGFKGDDCNEECTEGYYGYNCQRSCGHCEGRCNKITGLCDSEKFKLPYWIFYHVWFIISPIIAGCLLIILYRKCRNVYRRLQSRDPIYDDVLFQPCSQSDVSFLRCCPRPQELKSFESYVKRAINNGVLQQQFMQLSRELARSCEYGKLPGNREKNRYRNLIAYDETRVVLVNESSARQCDYINANYIRGYCKEKAYIATQAPLPQTVVDFWRMIWQEDVRVICMLVDLEESGQIMCEQYWPKVKKEIKYGNLVVSNLNQVVFAHYIHRTFSVAKLRSTEERKVEHLQYTEWPREGVSIYPYSVAEYLNKLLSIATGLGPIVVHCSSGAGRTGAIILSDICLRSMTAEGTVDIFAEAKKLYNARANMLDNYTQYVLPHLAPTHCLFFFPTKLSCDDISRDNIEKMKEHLSIHIARLEETSWMNTALRILEPIRFPLPENLIKNRFPKFTPVGPSVVTLSRYPTDDSNGDYISAVFVDGVKTRNQYVASQLPMPSTLSDFWRLVVTKNVELVIILQRADLSDPTCCEIVPSRRTLISVPYVKIENIFSYDSGAYFTTDKLLLTDTSKTSEKTRNLTILTCNNWSLNHDGRPPAPEALIELWKASEKISSIKGPILVVCHDGLTGCGLYLAMSYMLERMAAEQECDVILAVKAIRQSRSQFVYSKWQFEYLYDAAAKYAETFR